MKLSKSFSLNELTKSQTAEREGINNNPWRNSNRSTTKIV
jgi:hypothetical protein